MPFIASVEEPALCKYRISVCVPSLCVPVHHAPVPQAVADATSGSESASTPGDQASGGSDSSGVEAPPPPTSDAQATDASAAEPATVIDFDSTDQPQALEGRRSGSGSGGLIPAAQTSPTPKSDIPPTFLGLLWTAIVGDANEGYQAALSGGYATGIMPVRFG